METLNALSAASVMIVGDVMLDTYLWGRVDRISPEAPVPVVELEQTSSIPGGAANVAANVVGLGATAYLIGCVGTDPEGDLVRQTLRESGVRLEGLVSSNRIVTTHKTRIVAHSQQIVRIDRERREAPSEADLSELRDHIQTSLPQVGAIVVSDYAKGLLTPELVGWLVGEARSAGKPICVDPKGRDYSRYTGCSVVTPNKREAADACGLLLDEPELVAKAGARLLDELDCDSVLITEGENGMTLFERGTDAYHFDAAAQDVYDVTGAGDTVIATLTSALAAGMDVRSAAELANLAAGIVVQQVGTTTITSAALGAARRDA